MRVYLVQHAEAVPADLDPEQPLTPAGREMARRVARWLAATGRARQAEILHSTRPRAKQTAEVAGRLLLEPEAGPLLARRLDGKLWLRIHRLGWR